MRGARRAPAAVAFAVAALLVVSLADAGPACARQPGAGGSERSLVPGVSGEVSGLAAVVRDVHAPLGARMDAAGRLLARVGQADVRSAVYEILAEPVADVRLVPLHVLLHRPLSAASPRRQTRQDACLAPS